LDNRIFFPATKRNRHCIGDILSKTIQKSGTILEIASGSGEHGVVFQKRFPNIIWQTSDPDIVHRKSISSWIDYEELNMKMPQPLDIDVVRTPWYIPLELALFIQGIIAINMIHITPWKCTESLFKESGKLLKNGQFLMLYGPFKICNEFTSQSNFLFDKSLKTQNSLWGLRDLEEVSSLGSENGFLQEDIIKMPANNFALIYRKVCQ
tara:strand:+ start:1403 stop:2026 length:624 start_codon:yes stop_codon:yes gene_type:complete